MKINVLGLGYVGCVSAACLAKEGHNIVGVDINKMKVDIINNGKSPIIEKDLDVLIDEAVKNGNLRATIEVSDGVLNSDISLICVGTPSNENGSPDLKFIKRVSKEVGEVLRKKENYHTVVVRSTVLPSTVEETIIPIIEENSGKKVGEGFGIAMNPEFLREGSSVVDFYNPPFTLIGEFDKESGDIVEQIYSKINAPIVRTSIKIAEMVKYVSNAFHGLKIVFANEIGNICKREGIDSHKVMEIFLMDKKLNVSPTYLKPGFAFGGSCLPKDICALTYKAKQLDLDIPVLDSILLSNRKQIKNAIDLVLKTRKKNIGVFGLSFKESTDDIRESPTVMLIETLIEEDFSMKIYDKEISLAKVMGSNKEYIEKAIPHISRLLCSSIEEVVESSEVLVVANNEKEFLRIPKLMRKDQILIDLVRIINNPQSMRGEYYGICW